MPSTLPLKLAYPFLIKNGLEKEEEEIRTSKDQFGSYTSTLKRAKIVSLLKRKNLLDKFLDEAWPEGKNSRLTSRLERIYERFYKESLEEVSEEEEEEAYAFGIEADLQNFFS